MIHVLVPTRGRVALLSRMVESLLATAGGKVALKLRVDDDDVETLRYVANKPQINTFMGTRGRGYADLCPVYLNELVATVRDQEDVILIGNDDMVFETKGWDIVVEEEVRAYPSGLYLFGVRTGLNESHYPFLITSRRVVDKVGGKMFPSDVFFGDVFWRDVMMKLGCARILTNVTIRHDWQGHDRAEAFDWEQKIAYTNPQGTWREEYRELHDRRVREYVARLTSEFAAVA